MPNTVRPVDWAEEIGARIRKARERKHLSRADLGDLIQAHEKSIGNYERGEHVPWAELPRISDALDVDLRWLLHGQSFQDPLQRIARELGEIRVAVAELLELRRSLDALVQELLVQAPAEAPRPETQRRRASEAESGESR
jgi:transcriptional regulator with XRE-family HTH domain